ncbi:MAG: cytochrome c3 family protein [Longimicrobiales bacterium]
MSTSIRRWALAPLSAVVLFGCVDEQIVYRDRDLFEDPLAAAGNFLGYTDESTKLTVCGNCHVDAQGDWIGTAHADAWAGLQANPGSQAFCEGCHTVNELGNHVSAEAGYNATGEDRYHDVQCESCHGPGLTHATNPLETNAPLPAIDVGAAANQGCGECHSGAHHPFAEEWNMSAHGGASTHQSYRTRAGCNSCHGGEAALAAWGINTEFVEKGQNQQIGITCAVCHDPHSNDNAGQLRFSVSAPDVDQNLCMKCHQRRSVPDLGTAGTTTSGPHAPQGPLLLGEIGSVGWTPPNFAYNITQIRGTHGSDTNTRLCATCHVNSYDVTDTDTGSHLFTVTGHRFLPVPCVDASNVPTDDQSCGQTVAERNFGSCLGSGCHSDETAAFSALTVAEARIANRVTQLNNLLAQVPSSQFSSTDTLFTVAEGARFNAQLGAIESSAVHNPFLTEALLLASISAVQTTYSLPTAVGVSSADERLQALVSTWGH